jgi:hypothetical protein
LLFSFFSFNPLAAGGKDDSPDRLSGVAQESPAISDLFTRPEAIGLQIDDFRFQIEGRSRKPSI